MDFLRREANGQPQAARSNGTQTAHTPAGGDNGDRFKKVFGGEPRWLRIAVVVLLFSLTILALSIAMLFYFGNKSKEGELVDKAKVQAVFLTNGQVYFGKIAEVNSKYVNLQNIYYLNSQQQPEAATQNKETAQTSFSLVKLGCELHGPADQMIINREQVSFWENLTTTGKVADAINKWVQQNPNGQNCEAAATSNSTQPNAQNKQ
jgi:hypothetical protein